MSKIPDKIASIRQKLRRKISGDLAFDIFKTYQKLLAYNNIKICYNRWIPRDYDPLKRNILIATESPEVILHNRWIRDDMKFIAEISFANFYNSPYYLCCRTLYATNDNFVALIPDGEFEKNAMVSMIYSDKVALKGHKFRHQIATRYGEWMDLFGSGTGKSIRHKSESLDNYYFQVVIENGKYPEYVSEKFYDCLKRKTIPIYWGGEEGLRKMGFDPDGIIFFDTEEDLEKVFSKYVQEDFYRQREESVNNNLKRLIEIRNEARMSFYSNITACFYMHTEKSYQGTKYNSRVFDLD